MEKRLKIREHDIQNCSGKWSADWKLQPKLVICHKCGALGYRYRGVVYELEPLDEEQSELVRNIPPERNGYFFTAFAAKVVLSYRNTLNRFRRNNGKEKETKTAQEP